MSDLKLLMKLYSRYYFYPCYRVTMTFNALSLIDDIDNVFMNIHFL